MSLHLDLNSEIHNNNICKHRVVKFSNCMTEVLIITTAMKKYNIKIKSVT